MPAPLIIAAAIAVVTLGAGGISAYLKRHLANKRVAVLGAQQVGKTTLFVTLRDGRPPEHPKRTVDPAPGSTFHLQVGKREATFEIPADLRGHDGVGFPNWKAATEKADWVWYLFRADLIALGDATTTRIVEDHLTRLKTWLDDMKGPRPKVLLVGTFADQAQGYLEPRGELHRLVSMSDPIKADLVKIEDSALVVGSLATPKLAASLVKSIQAALS